VAAVAGAALFRAGEIVTVCEEAVKRAAPPPGAPLPRLALAVAALRPRPARLRSGFSRSIANARDLEKATPFAGSLVFLKKERG
jgi:hypothetical protein